MIVDLEVSLGRLIHEEFDSPAIRFYTGVRNVSDRDICFNWPVRGKETHLRLHPGCGWTPIAGSSLNSVNIWAEPTELQGMDDGLGGW